MKEDYKIEPLSKGHDRKSFDCGNDALNDFFLKRASKDHKSGLSPCFVITNGNKVLGFITLSMASVEREYFTEDQIRRMSKYPNLPVTLIGKMAIDREYQGNGLGKELLMNAFLRILKASEDIGTIAIIVDPKDEMAKRFYMKYGFLPLIDSERLFLPMETIKEAFKMNLTQVPSK